MRSYLSCPACSHVALRDQGRREIRTRTDRRELGCLTEYATPRLCLRVASCTMVHDAVRAIATTPFHVRSTACSLAISSGMRVSRPWRRHQSCTLSRTGSTTFDGQHEIPSALLPPKRLNRCVYRAPALCVRVGGEHRRWAVEERGQAVMLPPKVSPDRRYGLCITHTESSCGQRQRLWRISGYM